MMFSQNWPRQRWSDDQQRQWFEALVRRLQMRSPIETYLLDPVERQVLLLEIERTHPALKRET